MSQNTNANLEFVAGFRCAPPIQFLSKLHENRLMNSVFIVHPIKPSIVPDTIFYTIKADSKEWLSFSSFFSNLQVIQTWMKIAKWWMDSCHMKHFSSGHDRTFSQNINANLEIFSGFRCAIFHLIFYQSHETRLLYLPLYLYSFPLSVVYYVTIP